MDASTAHKVWELAGILQSAALVLDKGTDDRAILEQLADALSRSGDANAEQSSVRAELQAVPAQRP